ncbi:MAG: NAD(P)/FAD-dependent oxidoreductase [Oscillospiraceae bacterium]|nr:NAD(P)/FAD-dependent oxidoreductase [Oscillospiraceae bacterium]MBQ3986419.1 NAD(P)/FAD-dependent oxidoreductase [Oscillospiraceae bacterium]
MKFYKDHYEVVIIGGGLAGMACALQLQAWGIKDILILEKHNLPGGLATDFVRNGFEIEATLHEMMSIGTKDNRLKVGKFFDDMGVDIDWLHVPECYRVVLPNSGIDATLHEGYETVAREIDAKVPGTYDKVHELMLLCRRVYDSMNILSVTPMSKVQMLLKHPDFVKTVGYSATEVINTFDLPKKAVEMLTPYWIYVGNRMDDLPFTIYAFLMADYFTGSYVCRGYSHEMSMKMQAKVEENGAQFELRQEVTKILVKNGKVYGVRTARGDEISCDYVVSAAYPNKVYTRMIEPASEVPEGALKMVNGRALSVCPVSIIMVLEGRPEELGITNYSTFSGDTMDTNEIWENYKNLSEPYNYITTICLNYANPNCVPDGYTQLSITALPLNDPFADVTEESYFDFKRRLANEMIEKYLRHTGVPDFRDKIVEIEVETPMTVAHYVGAWKGSIYGYSHSLSDHAVARLQMKEEDKFIEGLEFAGAHGMSGDGMGPQITNGRAAAKAIREDKERKEKEAGK